MKNMLLKEIGEPESSQYNYVWETPNGGTISIVKTSNNKPKLVYCDKGKKWIEQNFPGIL